LFAKSLLTLSFFFSFSCVLQPTVEIIDGSDKTVSRQYDPENVFGKKQ
jgi:hypothetical protein